MLRPILVEELQNSSIFTNNIRPPNQRISNRYPKFNREFCNCSSELLLCSSIRRFYRRPACMQRKQIEVKSTAASRVEIGQVWHDSVLMMESRPQVQTLSWSNEGSKTRESEILPRQQQYSRIYKDVWCSRNTLHRDAFWEFPFRWIYYCNSSESTGKETDKTHLCALVRIPCYILDATWSSQIVLPMQNLERPY